jgi:tetratricopeptide (TPR) repeat protein
VDLGAALVQAGELQPASAVLDEAIKAAGAAGDERLRQYGIVERGWLRAQRGAAADMRLVRQECELAIRELDELGDDRGRAKAWRLMGWVHWFHCRASDAEAAARQALMYARRAGDWLEQVECLHHLAVYACFGPTPALEGLRRCEELLHAAARNRSVEAAVLGSRSVLLAMLGRFDEAQAAGARGVEIFTDLGEKVFVGSLQAQEWSMVDMMAGDWEAAETKQRRGCAMLEEVGEKGFLSTGLGMLGESLYQQGRYDEAAEACERAKRLGDPDDMATQITWRLVTAKILARRGRLHGAETLAPEATAMAESTDFHLRGDALLALAEVSAIGGRPDDAAAAAGRAIDEFSSKGNVVMAERTRQLLEGLGASSSP